MFGEIGALSGAPQSATFIAASRSVVLAVDRSAFQDFAKQSATADLGQRVRQTLDDLNRTEPD
jgi:CRP-like cAMP-binding protein